MSLEYFIAKVFENFGLNWKDYVEIDNSQLRPTDIMVGHADPSKASKALGGSYSVDVDGVVDRMCDVFFLESKK